jgi:ferredoxin
MTPLNGKRRDHSACSGCSLCLLACPVWHQTRDIRLTPHGRAKALQHGATAGEIAASIASCTLCGACVPACPEEIDLVGLMLDLRRQQPLAPERVAAKMNGSGRTAVRHGAASTFLLPGAGLRGDPARLARIVRLLGAGVAVTDDDGADIGLALEAGVALNNERVARFLDGLRGAARLIVADGIMHYALRRLSPGVRVEGLGEALSTLAPVRARLRASDLYVIEPRAFHGDYARLIGHYDALRANSGCAMNLDLQRFAVPTTANSAQNALGLPGIDAAEQARWILQGRTIERIVVEDMADAAVFASVSRQPVVHLGDV